MAESIPKLKQAPWLREIRNDHQSFAESRRADRISRDPIVEETLRANREEIAQSPEFLGKRELKIGLGQQKR